MSASAVPKLKGQPLTVEAVTSAHSIAVGFSKNKEGMFSFSANLSLISKIEKYFGLNLVDELSFFSATGKAGEIFEFPVSAQDSQCDRIFLVGVGSHSLLDVRLAGAALGRKLRGKENSLYSLVAQTGAEILAHGVSLILGNYQWTKKTSTPKLKAPDYFLSNSHPEQLVRAQVVAHAVLRARDMIHTPANIKTPAWMAQQAKSFARNTDLIVSVLSGKALSEFGGLQAVGNSSPNPGPRFIQVSYAPRGSKNWPHVVLVGKGITFDTGGISLKRPYDTMIGMKCDMSGAAAILSVVSAMPLTKPKVKVTALLMCAENALSGTAQRPSDVITHYGGTTVEVINTDAEGRLVLADGLAYANLNLDPDYLVDIATLTGAATLGLGRQYGAMYTRNDVLAKKLHDIGETSGDRVWHMPLIDDYSIALESSVADFNHTADKPKFSAGSVTAALFLEKFVGNRNWVHLDIAGPARSEADAGENPKGGTGFGVRLLIDWISSIK